MNTTNLLTLHHVSGTEIQRCTGPASDGSCPRVVVGALLPCAGHVLVADSPGAQGYLVPGRATLCPLTLASALAVPSDASLLEG